MTREELTQAQDMADACITGDVHQLESLLALGGNLDRLDADGCTALICACGNGQAECARLLLEAGADIHVKDGHSMLQANALHHACIDGHAACAQLLLEANADTDAIAGPTMMAALHIASNYGHAECVRVLLDAGASVDQHALLKIRPLSVACAKGHAECVQLLIDARANVNRINGEEGAQAPIVSAVRELHAPCVQLLLGARASTDVLAQTYAHSERPMPLLAFAACIPTNRTDATPAERLQVVQLLCKAQALRGMRTVDLGERAIMCETSRVTDSETSRVTDNEISAWLDRASRWRTALQHVELLSEAEAVAQLRALTDANALNADGKSSPLALAYATLALDPHHGAAAAMVAAAGPWSPKTHHLFPAPARARAVELLPLGYELAADGRFGGVQSGAVQQLWVEHVLPHAVERGHAPLHRDTRACAAFGGCGGRRCGQCKAVLYCRCGDAAARECRVRAVQLAYDLDTDACPAPCVPGLSDRACPICVLTGAADIYRHSAECQRRDWHTHRPWCIWAADVAAAWQ